jgi:hypothetical protein
LPLCIWRYFFFFFFLSDIRFTLLVFKQEASFSFHKAFEITSINRRKRVLRLLALPPDLECESLFRNRIRFRIRLECRTQVVGAHSPFLVNGVSVDA